MFIVDSANLAIAPGKLFRAPRPPELSELLNSLIATHTAFTSLERMLGDTSFTPAFTLLDKGPREQEEILKIEDAYNFWSQVRGSDKRVRQIDYAREASPQGSLLNRLLGESNPPAEKTCNV